MDRNKRRAELAASPVDIVDPPPKQRSITRPRRSSVPALYGQDLTNGNLYGFTKSGGHYWIRFNGTWEE